MDRGQYSDAVLSELENQNDAQLEGMSAKVKMLKDVRSSSFTISSRPPSSSIPTFSTSHSPPHSFLLPNLPSSPPQQITVSIGNEIRESTSLADSMNENFEGTRLRLKGTMKRMMRMAERTGVGWKVWLLFFVAIWGLFAYVWLF